LRIVVGLIGVAEACPEPDLVRACQDFISLVFKEHDLKSEKIAIKGHEAWHRLTIG
jgi:hypothetical protein